MSANRSFLGRPTDTRPVRFAQAAILAALVAAMGLLGGGSASAAQSIGISAGTFKFSTPPGKTLKGDLYVSNEGDTPIQVLIYTADLTADAKGKPSFTVPSRSTQPLSNSPASWTSIKAPDSTRIINNAPYLKLGVGERSHVFFQVDVPRGVPAGDYTMVTFFEMFNVISPKKGSASTIGGRVGSRVQVRVQGKITEKMEVRPFKVGSYVFGTNLPYGFTVRNDGNIDHNVTSVLELLTTDEEVKQKITVGNDEYIYAKGQKPYGGNVRLREFGFGKYVAELHVSYVKESMDAKGKISPSPTEIVKQRVFYVIPWSIVVPAAVILLVIVALIGMLLARRRSKRATPAQLVPPADVPPMGPGPWQGPGGGGGGWGPPTDAPHGGAPMRQASVGSDRDEPEPDGSSAEAGWSAQPETGSTSGDWEWGGATTATAGESWETREEPEEETILSEAAHVGLPGDTEESAAEVSELGQEETPEFQAGDGETAQELAEADEEKTHEPAPDYEEQAQEPSPADEGESREASGDEGETPDWKRSWGKVKYYGPGDESEGDGETG